jgi:hypothetical protein
MLVYHPALDVHHCMLRLLRLLRSHPQKRMLVDQLRILDFYLLFPHLLANVSVLRGQVAKKNKFAKRANRYNRVPSPKLLMTRLKEVQTVTLFALAAKSLIDESRLSEQEVILLEPNLNKDVLVLLESQTAEEEEISSYLATELSKIPLGGEAGLKSRTGLLEHRYDPT